MEKVEWLINIKNEWQEIEEEPEAEIYFEFLQRKLQIGKHKATMEFLICGSSNSRWFNNWTYKKQKFLNG